VGQTGRSFLVRYSEHKQAFRNNSHTSKFDQRLVEQAHSFGTIHNTMQVLHYQKKNAHLNKVERYYIHAEFTANNHLNDRTSFPMQSPKDPPAVINTLPLTPPPSDRSHGH